MATSTKLQEILGDVTECPICTETMEDPKCLPCIHTFCLNCLNQYWKEKQPGDSVPCPLCRMEFNIPNGGFSELAKNHFVEKLLEAQKLSKVTKVDTACDICSSLRGEDDEDTVSPAEKYCCDCEQHLCKRCARAHLITKVTKQHQVLPISEIPQVENFMKLGTRCNEHTDKNIKLYCMECEMGVCTTCFILEHSGHKGSDVNKVAEDLKSEIIKRIEETQKIVVEVNCLSETLEKCSSDFAANVVECERNISNRGEEIKNLIDKHVQALLKELHVAKAEKIKEIEIAKEQNMIQKISLDSFIKYSQTVLDKASPSDIVRLAKDLNVRADNLSKSKVIHMKDPAEIRFIPAERSILSGDLNDNIVGSVSSTGIKLSTKSYGRVPSLITSIQLQNWVRGVVVVGRELFVAIRESSEIKVYNSDTYSLQTDIKVPGLSDPWDMVADDTLLFVSELYKNNIHRIMLSWNKRISCWKAAENRNGLSITKLGSVLVTCYPLNKLFEYSTNGVRKREIVLQSDIVGPYRAIQLDNDQFLIDHDSQNRVCLIDNAGKLIKCFGGTQETEGGPLKNPYQMVVDQDGFILVADYDNSRVVLLNSKLEFVKDMIPSSAGMDCIYSLCLEEHYGKLYVSDYKNNKLAVFHL